MILRKPFQSYQIRSEEEKRDIVRSCLQQGVLKSEIMRMYGVSSYTVLYRWIAKYGNGILAEKLSIMPKKSDPKQEVGHHGLTEAQQLQARIANLEKELRDAELKTLLYEKMIEIAEQELKIPIRKKFGPQQSARSKQKKQ